MEPLAPGGTGFHKFLWGILTKNSRLTVLTFNRSFLCFARVLCFRVHSQTRGFMQNEKHHSPGD